MGIQPGRYARGVELTHRAGIHCPTHRFGKRRPRADLERHAWVSRNQQAGAIRHPRQQLIASVAFSAHPAK